MRVLENVNDRSRDGGGGEADSEPELEIGVPLRWGLAILANFANGFATSEGGVERGVIARD